MFGAFALSTARSRLRLGLPLFSVWVAACSSGSGGGSSPAAGSAAAAGAQDPATPAVAGSAESAAPAGRDRAGSGSAAPEGAASPLAPNNGGSSGLPGGGAIYGGGPPNRTDVELGPFRFIRAAANDTRSFLAPLAGVDLGGNQTALLALRPGGTGYGVFTASARGRVAVLNEGAQFVAPADLDLRGEDLLVADRVAPGGTGGIFPVSLATGTVGEVLAEGFQPASLTVDALGNVLFSGRDASTGQPGVFRIPEGGAVETVFRGAPLSDPSGIAVRSDGTVLVADTSFNGSSVGALFAINSGVAEVFASGFATGFPAGIAFTQDEDSVVVSGEGEDGLDRLFVIDVASRARTTVRAEFSTVQGSSGGLHRQPGSNTLVWSSGSFNGGTIFRLQE